MFKNCTKRVFLIICIIRYLGLNAQDAPILYDSLSDFSNRVTVSNIVGPNKSLCEMTFFEEKVRVEINNPKFEQNLNVSFNPNYKQIGNKLTLYNPLDSQPKYPEFNVRNNNSDKSQLTIQHLIFSNYSLNIPAITNISYDGIDFYEYEDEKVLIDYALVEFDSIYVNGFWFPVSSDTLVGGYDITLQTEQVFEEFIFDNCSIFFDSLEYTFVQGKWKLLNEDSSSCLGYYMNNLVEKNWSSFFLNKYTLDYEVESFLPDSFVTTLKVNSLKEEQLDLRRYTSLEDVYISTSLNKLNIKLPKDGIRFHISSEDSLNVFKFTSNNKRVALITLNTSRIKLKNTELKELYLNFFSPSDLSHISKIPKVRSLGLGFGFVPNLSNISFIEPIKSLLISADTIKIDCDVKLPKSLDSLVLYGYSDSFEFLNCNENLKYLGIYYLNDSIKPSIQMNYPELKTGSWCFPERSKISTNKGGKELREIVVGDTVLCINSKGEMSETIVDKIEYHKVENTLITELNYKYDYATKNDLDLIVSSQTRFTHQHPLIVNDMKKKLFNELDANDFLISSDLTLLNKNYIDSKSYGYTGFLVNVTTKEGNYFIDDICFSNK